MVHPAQGDDESDRDDDGPSGTSGPGGTPENPFEALGFPGLSLPGMGPGGFDLTQLMGMLSSPGPVNWEVARQVARSVALEDGTEVPPDPAAPAEFGELARAAQTHVAELTGLAASLATPVRVVTPGEWAELHLTALRPVLEALARNLGESFQEQIQAGIDAGELGRSDPITGLLPMLAPVLLGLQAGAMVGYLAHHALGRYDLPLPTADQPNLCFVARHIDDFESAWSLGRTDLRFYLAVHEVVHAATRSVPWVRERLVELATQYVSSYEIDPSAFEAEFGMIDPQDPESMQRLTESPERVLGAMQSQRQIAPREELQRLTSVMEGYADHVMGRVGRRLIPTFDQIHEAMQRHRVERGEAERFIEGLLGLKLERAHYERGQAFVDGVVERAGLEGLNRLWDEPTMLPTPNELDAPGLWLARIDLPDPD